MCILPGKSCPGYDSSIKEYISIYCEQKSDSYYWRCIFIKWKVSSLNNLSTTWSRHLLLNIICNIISVYDWFSMKV